VANIGTLLEIMRRLRDPEHGCPWDLEQSFVSIVPHTIEEAYEVADCIEQDRISDLPGELGDLLFQVVFYGQIAQEQGLFSFEDIVDALANKLVSRHPHVFADAAVLTAGAQAERWETLKAAERLAANDGRPSSELADVPLGLPALTRAKKLQKRAARVGFDWPNTDGVRAKIMEELNEVDAAISGGSVAEIEEEIGDLLFACVNWARHLNVEPESALRSASHKFTRRFQYIEAKLAQAGLKFENTSLARMDQLWDEAKWAEKAP
jgi:nucleoside triphosphate diphosphatase